MKLTYSLIAATTLMFTTTLLHATVLAPGDTNKPPDVFPDPGNPPVLGDITGTFNIANGTLTGTWEDIVAVDPFGVTCTGCLDFAFQVSIDQGSMAAIFGLNLGRFFGYTTDAGYVTQSGVTANSVSRGPFGGGITFNMINNNVAVLPGGATDFLVVATNAKTFDQGGNLMIGAFAFASQSNISGQVTGLFEPTFLPEPGTMVLLGVGLLGLAAFRKRTAIHR